MTFLTPHLIAPFDAVRLKNGTYCFVHEECWTDSPLVVRPKYVLTSEYPVPFMGHYWTYHGQQYARLGDATAVKAYIASHPEFFTAEGSVRHEAIMETVPARLTMNDFIEHTMNLDMCTIERKAAFDLGRYLIEGGISTQDIGITGSILLKGEIAGFSDFDLVLYGAIAIDKSQELLRKMASQPRAPLYYRTEAEAVKFYKKYSVDTELTAEEFSQTFPHKVSQGIMLDVPFSIFQVPTAVEVSLLKSKNDKSSIGISSKKETFQAAVEEDIYSRYTYRSLYKIRKAGEDSAVYDLFCHDRACMEQAKKGELISVSAYRIGEKSYAVYQNDGFIKRA